MSQALENYQLRSSALVSALQECEVILLERDNDDETSFIKTNANFLIRSFLVTLCGDLETFVKDLLGQVILECEKEIQELALPHNLIRWSIEAKQKKNTEVKTLLKDNLQKAGNLELWLTKGDLDGHVSASPYRIEKLLSMFDASIEDCALYESNKDLLSSIVDKRNKVMHHGYQASDLTVRDILDQQKTFESFVGLIDSKVCGRYPHLNL